MAADSNRVHDEIPAGKRRHNRLERLILEEDHSVPSRILGRTLLRTINLTERALLGPLTPNLHTPHRVYWRHENLVLMRYQGTRAPTNPTPVLLIPPLMVKPSIFDLWVGHSFVATLLEAGLDVWLLDFGVPQSEDRDIAIDDYVMRYLPAARDEIVRETGADELSWFGWSMGGIFILLYLAVHADEPAAKNAVIMGSPVDYRGIFPFYYLSRIAGTPGLKVVDLIGNVPPFLFQLGFKALAPVSQITRYISLLDNYWDRHYVAVYENMGKWVDEFIPYPGTAFKQFVTDFWQSNKLKKGELELGGKTVDLANVMARLLVIVGTKDTIATPDSVRAILDLVSSGDTRLLEVPLGHIGMMGGMRAADLVWQPIAEFLTE